MTPGNPFTLKWTVASAAGDFAIGSTAGNVESEWVPFHRRHVGIGLVWTGTTSGAITIRISNDKTNYSTLANTDFTPNFTNPAGTASHAEMSLQSDFLWFKVVYTRSGGTGTITGTAVEKKE